MLPERDIEKLKAIGYRVPTVGSNGWFDAIAPCQTKSHVAGWLTSDPSEAKCWAACKAHAQSPEGMVATMAAKVRWLGSVELGPEGKLWVAYCGERGRTGHSDSPEAAVDALFWKVP